MMTRKELEDIRGIVLDTEFDVLVSILYELRYNNDRQEPIREFLYDRIGDYKDSNAGFETKVGGSD